jgi:transcriptional regulator with XRE-family HTH domain
MLPADHDQVRADQMRGRVRPADARFDRYWYQELAGDGLAAASIGPLLTGIRLAAGKSQLRLAELLCAAAGLTTVTRHEVSRWEREERIPTSTWLRWLALVLEVPLDVLERAAAVARARRAGPAAGPEAVPARARRAGPALTPGSRARWPGVARRIDALRRMDDLVGGVDLAALVEGQLRTALARVPASRGPARRRHRLVHLAETAQLAGWVLADAGATPQAARAHVLALRAARQAGDSALAGLLLSCLAHLGLVDGPPATALRLAEAGYAHAAGALSGAGRALLLHRVAFAAARAGEPRRCERALAAADRAYDGRRAGEDPDGDPGGDPDGGPTWAYWLDEVELTAMTGRCYAVLRRPRIAEPLLSRCLAGGRLAGRPAALYSCWLAATLLDAGEPDRAGEVAGQALLGAVRLGSMRALRQVAALGPRLEAAGGAATRRYRELAHAVAPYLPNRQPLDAGPAPPTCGGCG